MPEKQRLQSQPLQSYDKKTSQSVIVELQLSLHWWVSPCASGLSLLPSIDGPQSLVEFKLGQTQQGGILFSRGRPPEGPKGCGRCKLEGLTLSAGCTHTCLCWVNERFAGRWRICQSVLSRSRRRPGRLAENKVVRKRYRMDDTLWMKQIKQRCCQIPPQRLKGCTCYPVISQQGTRTTPVRAPVGLSETRFISTPNIFL